MSVSGVSTAEYSDSLASTTSFFSSFYSADSVYNKQITIHDLPINILSKIFSYFTETELYECLSRVCRKWKFAVYNSSSRKDLHFTGNTASTEEIFDILRSSPNLQSVTFDSVPDIKTIIRQVCRCNKTLKNISIKNCSAQNDLLSESIVYNLLTSLKHMQSINVKGTTLSSYSKFFELLAQCENIKSINISLNKYLSMKELMTLVHNCKRLEELKLARCHDDNINITDENIAYLINKLKSTLTVLKLDAINIASLTFDGILKCSKLKHLSFTNAVNLTEDIFCKIFILLPELIELKIHEATQIKTTVFMKALTSNKTCVNNLQILKLTSCYTLNDEIIELILKKYVQTLRVLSLMSSCNVMFNINSEIMKKCKKLIYLNLAFTKTRPENFQSLVSALTNLKTIVTDSNSISNQYVWQDIQNKNPFLHIMIQENKYYNRHYTVYKL